MAEQRLRTGSDGEDPDVEDLYKAGSVSSVTAASDDGEPTVVRVVDGVAVDDSGDTTSAIGEPGPSRKDEIPPAYSSLETASPKKSGEADWEAEEDQLEDEEKDETIAKTGGEMGSDDGTLYDEGYELCGDLASEAQMDLEVHLGPGISRQFSIMDSTIRARPTIKTHDTWFPDDAAQRIYDAYTKKFAASATIRKALVKEFNGLTTEERRRLKSAYDSIASRSKTKWTGHSQPTLDTVVRKVCVGALRELLLSLLTPIDTFQAHWLGCAVKKKDTMLLTTVLCTMDSEEVSRAQREFNEGAVSTSAMIGAGSSTSLTKMKKPPTLLKQITDMTSFMFHTRNIQLFYKALLSEDMGRDPEPRELSEIEATKVELDATAIWRAKSDESIDKKMFIDMFARRSFAHLAAVSQEFVRISGGEDCIETLQSLFKESSETGYACVVSMYYASRRFEYLADLMVRVTRHPTRDYDLLTRLVVTRAERDLGNVWALCGLTLENWMKESLKSSQDDNYKQVLLTYCKPPIAPGLLGFRRVSGTDDSSSVVGSVVSGVPLESSSALGTPGATASADPGVAPEDALSAALDAGFTPGMS